MNLNCNYQFSNPAQSIITVGDLFEARCKMETAATASIDLPKLKVKFDEGKNYDLVILKSAQSAEDLNLQLTSYVVGPKDLKSITLTDGQLELTIQTPLQFEVKSILKPEEKPEMFGPMSGLSVAIPMIYWVFLGAILLLLITGSVGFIVRRVKRRKMLQRLKALDDGSQPVQQFFAGYRKIQRENIIFSARSESLDRDDKLEEQSAVELFKITRTIEAALRLFISRVFQIACFELSWKNSLSEFKKYNNLVFTILGDELTELTQEFQKIGKGSDKMTAKDVILISEKTRKWIEKADQLNRAILAKDTQQIKKMRGGK